MKRKYFTTGPTELYPEIKTYIEEAISNDICSINHRSKEFIKVCRETVGSLKSLLHVPEDYHVFFLSRRISVGFREL